jgi:DNA-binding XRE family transcriptional regulator
MAKRAPALPSGAPPKRVAIATADRSAASPKGAPTLTAKTDASVSPRASAKKPCTDDVSPELHVIFGENLRAARLACGLNQRQVAELTGLPQQYLSQIEQGQQNVTLKTVALLAKVLDHDVSTMLRRVNRSPQKT